MLTAHDVIDLVRRVRIAFVEQAILTAMAGPLGDESAHLSADVTSQGQCGAGLAL